jgi:hypothetical protein
LLEEVLTFLSQERLLMKVGLIASLSFWLLSMNRSLVDINDSLIINLLNVLGDCRLRLRHHLLLTHLLFVLHNSRVSVLLNPSALAMIHSACIS